LTNYWTFNGDQLTTGDGSAGDQSETRIDSNLSGHDEATGSGIDGDVTRHQADVFELLGELAVLLVGQRLDRRRVDDALLLLQRHGDRVPDQSR